MKPLDHVVGAARLTVIVLAPILFVRWLVDEPAGCTLSDPHYRLLHHLIPLLGLLTDVVFLAGRHLLKGRERDPLRAVDAGLLFVMLGVLLTVCVGKTPHVTSARCFVPDDPLSGESGPIILPPAER